MAGLSQRAVIPPALGGFSPRKGNLMRPFMIALVLLTWGSAAHALDWSMYTSTPATLQPPLEFHQIEITTTDSVKIGAWFLPPEDSLGTVAMGRRPAVLLLPTEGETLPDRLPLIAALVRRGFAVMAVEDRGHGVSQAFSVQPGVVVYPEYRVDASSALDILW